MKDESTVTLVLFFVRPAFIVSPADMRYRLYGKSHGNKKQADSQMLSACLVFTH